MPPLPSSSGCVLTRSCLSFPLFSFLPSRPSFPLSFPPLASFLQRANILKEVQIMRGLNHPSIVRLYNFTESRDFYYLTLECVFFWFMRTLRSS